MTHPEVREIAEEALRELMASQRRYCANYARARVCSIAHCEPEEGPKYWLAEVTNASDPALDLDMYHLMNPRMQGEPLEVRSEW